MINVKISFVFLLLRITLYRKYQFMNYVVLVFFATPFQSRRRVVPRSTARMQELYEKLDKYEANLEAKQRLQQKHKEEKHII